jgi:hypothetical protein
MAGGSSLAVMLTGVHIFSRTTSAISCKRSHSTTHPFFSLDLAGPVSRSDELRARLGRYDHPAASRVSTKISDAFPPDFPSWRRCGMQVWTERSCRACWTNDSMVYASCCFHFCENRGYVLMENLRKRQPIGIVISCVSVRCIVASIDALVFCVYALP